MKHERHKLVLLQSEPTVGWWSVKWRSSLSLISIDLHDALLCSPSSTLSLHKSVSEQSKTRVSWTFWGIGLEKNPQKPAIFKIHRGSIWGLSHPACCRTRKSLRGLNLNRMFWNTDYTVALEHLKLISLCCMTVWVMSPQWHTRALRSSPGGFQKWGGWSGWCWWHSWWVADQVCWNHKWLGSKKKETRRVEDLSESRWAAAKQQFSHVSLIKLVDIWKEMEERQRTAGTDEGQREEAAEQRVPTSQGWLMRLPRSHQVRASRL